MPSRRPSHRISPPQRATQVRKRFEIARAMAEMRREVLPIDPVTGEGVLDPALDRRLTWEDATNDRERIRRWWQKFPEAWVGVCRGETFVVYSGAKRGPDPFLGSMTRLSGDEFAGLEAFVRPMSYSNPTDSPNPPPLSLRPHPLPSALCHPGMGHGQLRPLSDPSWSDVGMVDTIGLRLGWQLADEDRRRLAEEVARGMWQAGRGMGDAVAAWWGQRSGRVTRRSDGLRVRWGDDWVEVVFEASRVALRSPTNHDVRLIDREALLAVVDGATRGLLVATMREADEHGIPWEVDRLDAAINVETSVALAVESLRLSRTPRVRGPATTRGHESVSWEGDHFNLRAYDRSLKTALMLRKAIQHAQGDDRRRLSGMLAAFEERHPVGSLLRLEVSLRRPALLREVGERMGVVSEGEHDLLLRLSNGERLPVRVDLAALRGFVLDEVAKLDGLDGVLALDSGNLVGPGKVRDALAAAAVAMRPELLGAACADPKLARQLRGHAAILRAACGVPDLLRRAGGAHA